MKGRVVNPYSVKPDEIQTGDVMTFIVKAMVIRPGIYRLYRCFSDPDPIPEGSRVYSNQEELCEVLFPSLAAVAKPDPW